MPGKRALIIGNSRYDDPTLAKLKAPEADVRALAELLDDDAIGGFEAVHTVVDESDATTRRAISGFFRQGKPDELLLLYFSGHGVLDDKGRLYLAAKDTQHDLPQATAVPAAFITDEMDSSRSRRQVLILDCCHSGAFARGARSGAGAKAVTESTFEGVGYGRAVLTATDATQYAWEGEAVIGQAENSVFTHYMIEGLRSGAADTDGDGDITLEELYDYIYGNVVKQTPKQTPRKWSYNQEGTLVIARNPKPPPPKATPLPPELQQSVDDPRTWVREGAVRELSRLLTGGQSGLALSASEALQRMAEADDSFKVRAAAREALTAQQSPHRAEAEVAGRAAPKEAVEAVVPTVPVSGSRPPEIVINRETVTSALRAADELEDSLPDVATEVVKTLAKDEARKVYDRFAPWLAKPWFPLAALSVGWGLAFFSGTAIFWLLFGNGVQLYDSRFGELVAIGLIGGAATWLSLRASLPRDDALSAILIIGAGVAIALMGSLLYPALAENGFGPDESVALERAILGTLGGSAIGILLHQRRTVNTERAVLIAIGWAIGWSVAAWLALSVYNMFGDNPADGIKAALVNGLPKNLAEALVPWVDALIRGLVGALAGLISGWVMLRQLRLPINSQKQ